MDFRTTDAEYFLINQRMMFPLPIGIFAFQTSMSRKLIPINNHENNNSTNLLRQECQNEIKIFK